MGERLVRLLEPLQERRRLLLASKELHQVAHDLDDELAWVQERLPLAMQTERGNGLQAVQQYIKKNQVSRAWARDGVRMRLHSSDRKQLRVVKDKKRNLLALVIEKTVDNR